MVKQKFCFEFQSIEFYIKYFLISIQLIRRNWKIWNKGTMRPLFWIGSNIEPNWSLPVKQHCNQWDLVSSLVHTSSCFHHSSWPLCTRSPPGTAFVATAAPAGTPWCNRVPEWGSSVVLLWGCRAVPARRILCRLASSTGLHCWDSLPRSHSHTPRPHPAPCCHRLHDQLLHKHIN